MPRPRDTALEHEASPPTRLSARQIYRVRRALHQLGLALVIIASIRPLSAAQRDAPSPSIRLIRTNRVDRVSGIDCSGTRDSRVALQHALDGLGTKSRTVFIPSQCRLGLGSPGANAAAIVIPDHVHILCEDQSAGFFAARRRCVGGTYPDAACSTDAECLGGGSCAFDFGSSTFAPDASATYTMLADPSPGASDIVVENCSFWTYQADPYQRCVGGTTDGDPCRQECDGGSERAGLRCDVDADCASGACMRIADCSTRGGTCTGAPHSSTGPGRINAIDLKRTIRATLIRVSVYDHFTGDFSIAVGEHGTISDSSAAREITDCSSPLATPSDSHCFSTEAARCCYGAATNTTALANHANTQPTTAVEKGIVLGADSHVRHSSARGSTAAIFAAEACQIDDSTVWPPLSDGPGTPSGGYVVGARSKVAKSNAPYLKAGGIGIALGGADTAAIENLIGDANGSAHVTGILIFGANANAIGNIVKHVDAPSAIGIDLAGERIKILGNTIEGNGSTATGIRIGGHEAIVTGNSITSRPPDSLGTGIAIERADRFVVDGNTMTHLRNHSIHFRGFGAGARVANNASYLSSVPPTTSLQPIHVLYEDGTQTTIANNYFVGGWRGIASGRRPSGWSGLTNVNIVDNRFDGLFGAPFAVGGAGVLVQGNYVNGSGGITSRPSLTCDATCTNRGTFCMQDDDCNGCNASVAKCLPEPLSGFVGSPTERLSSAHSFWSHNLLFNALPGNVEQCSGGTSLVGQLCTVSAPDGTCAGGAPCSGMPRTCQGGQDDGKYCCQTGTGAACNARSATPYIRILDYGAHSGYTDVIITSNQMFGGGSDGRYTFIDFVSSASLGNIGVDTLTATSNLFHGSGATNVGIDLPTAGVNKITHLSVTGNNFVELGVDVRSFVASMGDVAYVPKTTSLPADLSTSSTSFVDVNDLALPLTANRTYSFRCDFQFSSSVTSNGIGFAMTGPSNPTSFTYLTEILQSASTGGNGMVTLIGNGDDATATATSSVEMAGARYWARITGTIVTGSDAGKLQARVKAETTNDVTVLKGSTCSALQVP